MNNRTLSLVEEELTYKKGGNNMKTKMKKLIKNQKGMTLIELLAVIVIIAIVALIAIPAIANVINNSKDKAILSDASQIISSAKIAIADGACDGTSANACTQDNMASYVEKANLPTDATYKVTKDNAGVYTLTYSEFSGLKTDKFYDKKTTDSSDTKIGSSNIVTSSQLAKIMGNK